MVSIYFEDDSEALKILDFISERLGGTEVNELIHYIPATGLAIDVKDDKMAELIELLSHALQSFILNSKIYSWVETIVRSKFYYEDQDEIDQIIDITRSILEGSKKDDETSLFKIDRNMITENLLTMILSGVSFSFDSFAKFRLKGYQDSLMPFVEQAIDEYKMEQDYQNFIQTLRDFMSSQPSKIKALHLLHDEVLHFYNESFKKLDSGDLFRLIDRKLFSENPLYIDSKTIAPLISIAPQKLFVYTDEMENGLIQTIIRIFEERSILKTRECFAKEQRVFYDQINSKNQVL